MGHQAGDVVGIVRFWRRVTEVEHRVKVVRKIDVGAPVVHVLELHAMPLLVDKDGGEGTAEEVLLYGAVIDYGILPDGNGEVTEHGDIQIQRSFIRGRGGRGMQGFVAPHHPIGIPPTNLGDSLAQHLHRQNQLPDVFKVVQRYLE